VNELLISLAILGIIATFTIPKILSSSDSAKNRAITKDSEGTGNPNTALDAPWFNWD
jgi:type II secretory pathway pseudopilin PulG